jgi:hypothetical protein
MVPKPGVDPEAAVLETSMVPTVTLEHVVAQVMEQSPEHEVGFFEMK